MKWLAKWVWFLLLALSTSAALAQSPAPQPRQPFSQAELDQMLAPIALYPDSLLSQILMAATYPREVAEAASWSRANAGMSGDDAVRAAQNKTWDPAVISLTAFPQVLAMMGQRRYWTERLGEAYLEQPEQVMDTVQGLRARADAAGSLRSSEEIVVQRQGDDYVIEPPMPEVVHVPYYDPRVAYGRWWWPEYQPVYWNPWPGYAFYPGYGGFGWGYGITLSSGFFFGAIDWRHRYVRYSHHRPWYFHGRDWRQGQRWTHNRDYRRDVARDQRLRDGNQNRVRDGNRDGRRWDRGDRADSLNQAPRQQPQRGTAAENPMGRPNAPRYQTEGAQRERVQPGERVTREQPANAIVRPAEARSFGVPRGQQLQRVPAPEAPQVVPHSVPAPAAAQAPRPSGNPMSRESRESREPVERSAPSSSDSSPSGPASGGRRGGRGVER